MGTREEARAWLAENWNPADRQGWLAKVVDAGYAVPRWPREAHGLGLTDAEATAIEEEFRAAGAPGAGQDRTNLWANTLLAYGTKELQGELLRPLLENRVGMCLLYSEPGAGSDLAGVRTRAVSDGGSGGSGGMEYIVNGQKVWTSMAAEADYGMLIARTDPEQPKHRGLSFFFLPMKQPGVQVRPLRQMTGEAHFNEVFLTDARVPAANMLGTPGDGWRVLMTALAVERVMMGEVNAGVITRSGGGGEADLVELARRHGRLDDPVLRQDLSRLLMLRAVNRWNNQRVQAEAKQGGSMSAVSIGKLLMSRIVHETGRVQTEIVGPAALLEGEANPDGDSANFAALNAFFTSIGGGTDQVQRNIVGERVLGLPREPDVDRAVPFSQIRHSG